MEIDTEAELKEKIRGQEIMRLNILARDVSVDKLLDAALAGRERSRESVTKLYGFVLRNFGEGVTAAGPTGSSTTDKVWEACSAFLGESGVTDEELHKIRHPYPRAGEPGFRSVLDEMEAEAEAEGRS